MKKIGLIFLTVLLASGWMADSALAGRYGHSRWRAPGVYWSGSVVVAGPALYPHGRYVPRPVVVRQPPVYVQPVPVYPAYGYYPVVPGAYYPYSRSCSAGWAVWGP